MIRTSLTKLNRACLQKIPKNPFGTVEKYQPYIKYRDHVINGYTNDGLIRFAIIDCSDTVSESLVTFTELKTLSCNLMLQKTFCFAMLNAAFNKHEERIKVIYSDYRDHGENKIATYCEAMANGEARGFVDFKQSEPPNKRENPYLYVGKVLYEHDKEYETMIPVDSELPESDRLQAAMNKYYEGSEQIPTIFSAFCWPDAEKPKILGYLVQALPGCPEKHLRAMEEEVFHKIYGSSFTSNSKLDVNEISEEIDKTEFKSTLRRAPVDFFCRCNIEDFKIVLQRQGTEVVSSMRQEKHNELKCLYCNKSYLLSENDFEEILKKIDENRSG